MSRYFSKEICHSDIPQMGGIEWERNKGKREILGGLQGLSHLQEFQRGSSSSRQLLTLASSTLGTSWDENGWFLAPNSALRKQGNNLVERLCYPPSLIIKYN